MVLDLHRLSIPGQAGVLEVAHELFFLGIDADDRLTPRSEALAKLADVDKLLVAQL